MMEKAGLGEASEEEAACLRKIRRALSVISELEMEKMRLAHFFAHVNQMLAEAAAAGHLPPPPLPPAAPAAPVPAPAPAAPAAAPAPAPAAPAGGVGGAAAPADFERCFRRCATPWALADGAGAFVAANDAFAAATGYARDELAAHTVFVLARADGLGDFVDAFRGLLAAAPPDAPRPPALACAFEGLAKPDLLGARRPLSLAAALCYAGERPDIASHIHVFCLPRLPASTGSTSLMCALR